MHYAGLVMWQRFYIMFMMRAAHGKYPSRIYAAR
jgi:hypothetical protein